MPLLTMIVCLCQCCTYTGSVHVPRGQNGQSPGCETASPNYHSGESINEDKEQFSVVNDNQHKHAAELS